MSAISWHDVAFAYPDGPEVLEAHALDVDAGEVLLVVGSSGSGKSTLLRTTNGLVPHSSGGRFRGEVVAFGRSVRSSKPRDLADVVGFVNQDPEAQFVVDHVEHDLAFVLENLGTDQVTMRRRIEEILDALGIAHLRDRSPATLSGGEKQRCAIAGALAAAPAALVLDEPTSMLDPQGADDVLAAIGRLNDDLGTTVVIAEHRLERAAPMADHAVLVEDGQLTSRGRPHEVVASYDGAPTVTELGRLLGWDPLPLTVREGRAAVRRHAPEQLAPPPTGSAPAYAPGAVLLSVVGVDVAPGRHPVLSAVDLTVAEGEVVALLGRNGSGKTSLLRCLAGALTPARGSVRTDRSVAYVPQDPNALLFSPTVRRELAETLRLLGRRDHGEVDQWLARLGLTALAERHPRSLSTGERQRVAIAAVAIGDAAVLLLDEPTRGIDAPSRAALERAIAAHAEAGGAVMLATHDVELAARCATRVVVLGGGDVVADGPAREVLSGSLFAPQVLRVLPPYLTVAEVAAAQAATGVEG